MSLLVRAADAVPAVGAARLSVGLGAAAVGRNVIDGRNVTDGCGGGLVDSSVGDTAPPSICPRDGGSNRSTPGSGTGVLRVSTTALPSRTAIKQIAQIPHFRTTARRPESSLNTGLSVLTTTEPFSLASAPDTPEIPDMVKHAEGVHAEGQLDSRHLRGSRASAGGRRRQQGRLTGFQSWQQGRPQTDHMSARRPLVLEGDRQLDTEGNGIARTAQIQVLLDDFGHT